MQIAPYYPEAGRWGRGPAGHAKSGMAHGIGGPLALLAFTATRGISVPGHFHAIGRIRAWLDHWRHALVDQLVADGTVRTPTILGAQVVPPVVCFIFEWLP